MLAQKNLVKRILIIKGIDPKNILTNIKCQHLVITSQIKKSFLREKSTL